MAIERSKAIASGLWKILQLDILHTLNLIKKDKVKSFDTSKENEIILKELINSAQGLIVQKRDLTYDDACNILFQKQLLKRLEDLGKLKANSLKNFDAFLESIELLYSDVDPILIKQMIKEDEFSSLVNGISSDSLENAKSLFGGGNRELVGRRIRYLVNEKQILKSINEEAYDPARVITNMLYKANFNATASTSQNSDIVKVFNKEMKQKVVLSDLNDSIYSALKDISKYIVTEPALDKMEGNLEKPSKIVMVNMCDIHVNEGFVYKNRPEMSWTPEICVATFNRVLDHVTKLKDRYNIVGVKIAMLGDMIGTGIHQELFENLSLGPNTAERVFSVMAAQLFTYINKYIAPAQLICVPGNHAERRVGHEKRDTFGENNSDSLCMQEIHILFNDLEIVNGLVFPRDQDFAVYMKIGDKNYQFSHGDRKHGEGVAYGDSLFTEDKLDYSVVGHFHHPEIRKLGRVTEFILPTLKKPDPYTKNNGWDVTSESIGSVLIIDPTSGKVEKMENFILDSYDDIGYVKFNFNELTEDEIVRLKKYIREENGVQIVRKDAKSAELYNKLKLNMLTTHSFSSLFEKITESKEPVVKVGLFKDKLLKDFQEAYNDNKANKELSAVLTKIGNEIKTYGFEFVREKGKYKLNFKVPSDKIYVYNKTLDGVILVDKMKTKYVLDTEGQILYKLVEDGKNVKKIKVDLKGDKVEEYIDKNKFSFAKFDISKINGKTYSSFKDLEESKEIISTVLKGIYKRILIDYPKVFLEDFEEEIQEISLDNLF